MCCLVYELLAIIKRKSWDFITKQIKQNHFVLKWEYSHRVMRETYETWCRTALGSNSGCRTDCAGCASGPKLHGWSLTQCQKSPTHESHTWMMQRWYITKYRKHHTYVFEMHLVHSAAFPGDWTMWLSNMSFWVVAAITATTLLDWGFPVQP